MVVNSSLSERVLPLSLKEALVCFLLTKLSMDPKVLNNFHPGLNLPFLEVVIEKVVVAQQLWKTLGEADYLDTFQSPTYISNMKINYKGNNTKKPLI